MPLRKLNVLLIDNDEHRIDPLITELNRAGFSPFWKRVSSIGDYEQQLRTATEPIDLIFLDYGETPVSVSEALGLLHSLHLDIPLIILSNTPVNGEAATFVRLGASDIILKDRLPRLAASVTRIMAEKQLQRDLQKANGRLFSTYDNILHAWAYALELRDFETLAHTMRVRDLTVKLARYLGIRGDRVTQIGRGALLHDIGKLGIPDKILLKPGPLTPGERAIMEQHPRFGYMMLSPIEFLKPAVEIPLRHHEKWDGSGYPDGLAGEEIPFTARIFAVVDVWDALNSSRPYRPEPWPKDRIVKYIQDEAGRHFDPDVADAFLTMLRTNGKLI